MAYSTGTELTIGAGRGEARVGNNASIDDVGGNSNPSVRGSMPVTGTRNQQTFQGDSGAILQRFGDAIVPTAAEIQAANAEAQQGINFVKKNALWFLIGGLLLYKFLFRKED